MTGRFAPSPTGPLHVGNLRTALLAWLVARSADETFLVRMEDLDRATSAQRHERAQLDDLAALGLDHDGVVVRQSERFALYDAALTSLIERGLTYECYCTRREIRDAATAPHGDQPDGAYPGTCRDLTAPERAARRRDRPPAIRLKAGDLRITIHDELAGTHHGHVDDDQDVRVVVRGDDLLASTPRQVLLQRLLDLPTPRYVHVPMVVGPDGQRLAKRHGAVTLADVAAEGVPAQRVLHALAASLGLIEPGKHADVTDLARTFDLASVARRGRAPVALAELQRTWQSRSSTARRR